MEDNPLYANKQFKITWEWKLNKFQCCDGVYDIVEAQVPSILKIELLKTNHQ